MPGVTASDTLLPEPRCADRASGRRSRNPGEQPAMPSDLLEAIERGEITLEQLRELIRIEALDLGFELEEAILRARARTLPRGLIADDLELLVGMLPA